MVGIPRRLRAQQNPRPVAIGGITRVESITCTEVADVLAALVSRIREQLRDFVQTCSFTHWSAGHDARVSMSDESDHSAAIPAEPEINPGIQDLVCCGVPAVGKHQFSRLGALGFSRLWRHVHKSLKQTFRTRHASNWYRAKSLSPSATRRSPPSHVPPPVGGSSNRQMTLVCTDVTKGQSCHAIEGDDLRGVHVEGSYGNDVGEHTQPASGVAGTSSACYPSHRAASKFS